MAKSTVDHKHVVVVAPGAILDNTSPVSAVIDCRGFNHCTIDVQLGALDVALTALKLQESDVKADANSLTGGTDVPGCVYGTSTDNETGAAAVLPTATDDNKVFTFDVPLRGRKRFLDLIATIGDGTAGGYIAATARLSQGGVSRRTKTLRNQGGYLRATGG